MDIIYVVLTLEILSNSSNSCWLSFLDLACDFEFDLCKWTMFHGGTWEWKRVTGQDIIDDPSK